MKHHILISIWCNFHKKHYQYDFSFDVFPRNGTVNVCCPCRNENYVLVGRFTLEQLEHIPKVPKINA
jgi:hypothetical protein